MIIQNQKVKTKWSKWINRQEYESKGYIYTGRFTELEVDIKDLSLNSSAKVKVQCDYCKIIYLKEYNIANKMDKHAWGSIENKITSDMKRYSYLKQFNWKMIRIVCKCDKLYEYNKIIELIKECKDYLLNSNHSWIEINIDENKIKCKEFEKDIEIIK